ncbi:hypothetical protein FB451DRAFT_1445183 [Mycena latifolia]|nr:hypothetical protein FB451DRAFT_1445183 [Mycena latifolia]
MHRMHSSDAPSLSKNGEPASAPALRRSSRRSATEALVSQASSIPEDSAGEEEDPDADKDESELDQPLPPPPESNDKELDTLGDMTPDVNEDFDIRDILGTKFDKTFAETPEPKNSPMSGDKNHVPTNAQSTPASTANTSTTPGGTSCGPTPTVNNVGLLDNLTTSTDTDSTLVPALNKTAVPTNADSTDKTPAPVDKDIACSDGDEMPKLTVIVNKDSVPSPLKESTATTDQSHYQLPPPLPTTPLAPPHSPSHSLSPRPIPSRSQSPDLQPAVHGTDGWTHRDRNPLAPQKPVKLGGTSIGPTQANALKNTSNEQHRVLKTARASLKEAVEQHRGELADKCKRLSEELKLPLRDVEAAMRGASKIKKKRAENMRNALVWDKGLAVNEGKGHGERLCLPALQRLVQEEEDSTPKSKEEKEVIVEAFMKMKEAKAKGTRVSNREAAKDVTWVVDQIYDELVNLEARTGARALLIIAGSSVTDTISPTVLGTDNSTSFVSGILKMSTTQLASKFGAYSCLVEGADDEGSHSQRRGKCVAMIQDGLQRITGKPKVKMEYINYRRLIQHGMGVELVGLPPDYILTAPSKSGQGGAERTRALLDRLKSNTCRWEKVSDVHRAELREEFENAPKKQRKTRSDKKGTDEEEEEDTEPVKEKKGKKQRQKKGGQEGEDVSATTKSAGSKRKQSEVEEDDSAGTSIGRTKAAAKFKTKTVPAKRKHAGADFNDHDDAEAPARKKSKDKNGKPSKPDATMRALVELAAKRTQVRLQRGAADEGIQKIPARRRDRRAHMEEEEEDDNNMVYLRRRKARPLSLSQIDEDKDS